MVLSQLSIVRDRMLRLVIAVLLALPIGLGVSLGHAITANASVCYPGPWTYDTVTESPTYGASFQSQVLYKIGYSCAGYADSVYIYWWGDTMSFSNSESYVSHGVTQSSVCDPFDTSAWYCSRVWGPDYSQQWCKANCTISHNEYPQRWFNYDPHITVTSHWAGINTYANLNYSAYHQFLLHRLYHDECC